MREIVSLLPIMLDEKGLAISLIAKGDTLFVVTQHHHGRQGVEQCLHKRELLIQLAFRDLALGNLAAQAARP